MNSKAKSLSDSFKRIIFQGLEKIDINLVEQRNGVYLAAFRSLEKTLLTKTELPEETKTEHRNTLEKLIHEIEAQLSSLLEKEKQTSLQNVTADVTLEATQQHDEGKERTNLSFWSQRLKLNKNLLSLLAVVTLILAIISAPYYFYPGQEASGNDLELPYVLEADEVLFQSARTKGSVITDLVKGDDAGILYELDTTSADSSNQLDFVLRGDLGQKLNAIREPILITFHIEKRSKEDIGLNFLVRGASRTVRKNVKILDQNTNQYFIVTNSEQIKKSISNLLIRVKIAVVSEKYEENPSILIKKMVFSKI